MSIPLTDKTLVLDLDECCVHTHVEEGIEDIDIMAPSNVGLRARFFNIVFDECGSIWGVKRPYLDQFLSFSARYFRRIIVWSAGEKEYVLRVVKEIFKDHKQPDLVLTRDDCAYRDAVNYHKPISVLKKLIPDLDVRTVLVIDDKTSNFKENPHNGVTIPEFRPEAKDSFTHEDHCLAHIINWLMSHSVLNSRDFTKLDKKRIFSSQKPCLEKYKQHLRYTHHCYFSPLS